MTSAVGPIPQWLSVWGAAAALFVAFLLLGMRWRTPQLHADSWRPLPIERLATPHGRTPWRTLPSRNQPYLERLGRWPAAVGLFIIVWVGLVFGWHEPVLLLAAGLGYGTFTLGMQAVFGLGTWMRNGDILAVSINLFARMSIFEIRDGVLGTRRPLSGLSRLDPAPGTAALVFVILGTVIFDRVSHGDAWPDDLGGPLAAAVTTLGLLGGIAVVGGFYAFGIPP